MAVQITALRCKMFKPKLAYGGLPHEFKENACGVVSRDVSLVMETGFVTIAD